MEGPRASPMNDENAVSLREAVRPSALKNGGTQMVRPGYNHEGVLNAWGGQSTVHRHRPVKAAAMSSSMCWCGGVLR